MISGASTGVNTLPNGSGSNVSAAAAAFDGKIKQANKEALHLLIQNKKKKEQSTGSNWVPAGSSSSQYKSSSLARDQSRGRKLFY